MKKLTIIALIALSINCSFAQQISYYELPQKPLSFQVEAMAIDYMGLKYGISTGISYKEMLSVSYFYTINSEVNELLTNNSYAGLHVAFVVPVAPKLEAGAGFRAAKFSGDWQDNIWSGEIRYTINDEVKVALEHGMSANESATAVRFIFNL